VKVLITSLMIQLGLATAVLAEAPFLIP